MENVDELLDVALRNKDYIIIDQSTHRNWLCNPYLVLDGHGELLPPDGRGQTAVHELGDFFEFGDLAIWQVDGLSMREIKKL